MAPATWSPAALDKLSGEAIKAARSKAVFDKLGADAALAVGNSSTEFAHFIHSEQARWKPVIARAHITL